MAGLGSKESAQAAKGVVVFLSQQLHLFCIQSWAPKGALRASCLLLEQTGRQSRLGPGCACPMDASTWYIIDGASNCAFSKVYRLFDEKFMARLRMAEHSIDWQCSRQGVQGPFGDNDWRLAGEGAAISGTVPSS